MKQQMEDMMTKFEETEKTAVNSLEKVTSLEEELSIVKKQLDEKEKDYDKLRLETEALLKGESVSLEANDRLSNADYTSSIIHSFTGYLIGKVL